jgi:hypothetical protein
MEEKNTYTRTVVVTNEARCLLCKDVIQSFHGHDFVTCSCGNLSVDGGNSYLKRSYRDGRESWEELSETYDEDVEKNW